MASQSPSVQVPLHPTSKSRVVEYVKEQDAPVRDPGGYEEGYIR